MEEKKPLKMYRVAYGTDSVVQIRSITIDSRTAKQVWYFDRMYDPPRLVMERLVNDGGMYKHRWFEKMEDALVFAIAEGEQTKVKIIERITELGNRLKKVGDNVTRWKEILNSRTSTECALPCECAEDEKEKQS